MMFTRCAGCWRMRWGVVVYPSLSDDRVLCPDCADLLRVALRAWERAHELALTRIRERYQAGVYADDDPYLQPPPKRYEGYSNDAVA